LTQYDLRLTYTDSAFNTVQAFLLGVSTETSVITPGVITLASAKKTSLSFTATEAAGGALPYLLHEWSYSVHGMNQYQNFSVGLSPSTLNNISPNVAYDISLTYYDSAGNSVTAYLLNVSTSFSVMDVQIGGFSDQILVSGGTG
jgi:hypothetical protein